MKMNLKNILFKAGGAVLSSVVPGGGLILELINGLLPKDKKLGNDATGDQAMGAIQTLPADQQAKLLSKELDVEIAEIGGWSSVMSSLAQADSTGNTTRPRIALMMAWMVCFEIGAFSTALLVVILMDKTTMVTAIKDLWPLVLAMLATPLALLRAYFGMRMKEKKARYDMAAGKLVANPIQQIVAMFKK